MKMHNLLDKLKAASVSGFEKCGEILWAPRRKAFTYCCWHCAELFMEITALERHIYLEHGNLCDWSDLDGGAEASREREKLVFSYTVEELLADGNEEEIVGDNRQKLGGDVGVKCTGEKLKMKQLSVCKPQKCSETANSTYICELNDEELIVNVTNEYDDTDIAETIEYSVEEVRMLLEAEQLMSQHQQEGAENSDESGTFTVGQVSMDSGVGLQETHEVSAEEQSVSSHCQAHNKPHVQALNLTVRPFNTRARNNVDKLKETAIVASIDKTPNIAELVEAFYKDFNPKPQNLPVDTSSNIAKQVETSPTNNAFKVWDLFDQHSTKCNRINGCPIESNKQTTTAIADKPCTLSHVSDKSLSADSKKLQSSTQFTVKNAATIKNQVLAQSTPKQTPKITTQNFTSSRAQHEGNSQLTTNSLSEKSEVTCPSLLKSYTNVLNSYPDLTHLQFSTLLKNPYTHNTSLHNIAELNAKNSTSQKIESKRQMLQRMHSIKKRILETDIEKENAHTNAVASTNKSTLSNSNSKKGKVPLNVPNTSKVASAIVKKVIKLNGATTKKSLTALEATKQHNEETHKNLPATANDLDVSIEILEHSKAAVVNLSAFDCILNDSVANGNTDDPLEITTSDLCYKPNDTLMQLKNIKMGEEQIKLNGFQHDLNNSIEDMELDTSIPLSDTTLNITSSSDPDTSIVDSIEDAKLLETVGLKAMHAPALEIELPLARIESIHLKAFQFANLYRNTPYIWLNKFKEVKTHEQLDIAFDNFTAQINTLCRSQLTKEHVKRLLNLITIWYTTCQDTKLMRKKQLPKSMDFYLLLFAFLPKTARHIYYCEFCPSFFRAQMYYMRHRATHTGHLFYKCQHCGREFLRSKSLQTHEAKCKKKCESSVEDDQCVKECAGTNF